jgi:hypothetical protein
MVTRVTNPYVPNSGYRLYSYSYKVGEKVYSGEASMRLIYALGLKKGGPIFVRYCPQNPIDSYPEPGIILPISINWIAIFLGSLSVIACLNLVSALKKPEGSVESLTTRSRDSE